MTSLHQRLLDVWRSAAETGKPLPSEVVLAESLGVSRPKVREELIRLESDGLVTRIPNSGTFPNRSALNVGVRLDQSYEFSAMLGDAGFQARVEVVESEWIELDPQRAAQLGVRAGASAFQTIKRWFANEEPVMVAVDAIPAARSEPSPDAASTVFTLVERLRGSSVAWETSRLRAETADDRYSVLLSVPKAANVLEMSTLGMSMLGAPLYIASETYRQGVVPFGLIRNVPVPDGR